MRPLLLILVACYLLSASPALPKRHSRPPDRPLVTVIDSGAVLPDSAKMECLAREQPLEFIKKCMIRYQREVKSYRLIMSKQERINGTLEPAELMYVAFREEPFSVSLKWKEGERKARRVLYVQGEYEDMLLVRLTPFWHFLADKAKRLKDGLKVVDPQGDEALEAGRFPITTFGMYNGLNRLLDDWQWAQEHNELQVEYLGEEIVDKAGGRRCYVLRGRHPPRPGSDGVTEQTVYIDTDTWMQVGSVGRGKPGLIGAYFYRDIEINPPFDPNQFTIAGLKE